MDAFFEDLYKRELIRDESYLYTLRNTNVPNDEQGKTLDRFFILDQALPSFAPDKNAMLSFAGATYLYSLFGFVPKNFTAVRAGYLATFERNQIDTNSKETATVFMSSGAEYYREKFIELCDQKLQSNINEIERKFYEDLKGTLLQKEIRLSNVACYANAMIMKNEKELGHLTNNLIQGTKELAPSDSLNSRNCENNHVILFRIICDRLGYDYNNVTPEQKQEVEKQTKLFMDWIIGGYFTFIGHDRSGDAVSQNAQILNDPNRLRELYNELESMKKTSMVVNMCATDYTADMVYMILGEMLSSKDGAESSIKIDGIIPDMPFNKEQKKDAEDFLIELCGSGYFKQEQPY